MKLLDIYRHVLAFAGMVPDENGFINTINDNEPVFVEGNRLVVPTKYQLRECMDKERIGFHPLSEKIIAGESNAVKKLRKNINILLNHRIVIVGQTLLNVVASKGSHDKLNPEQLRLLTRIKDVDTTSTVNFSTAAIAAIKEGPDRAFVNIYLCRGGVLNGKKYARLGVTSFPFFKNLIEDKIPKIRQKDKETFKQLLEFMFEDIAIEDGYSVGSDTSVAPFLQALLTTAAPIAIRLNELIDLYQDHIPFDDKMTKEGMKFDLEWLDSIVNMEDLKTEIHSVPPQNDGPISSQEAADTFDIQARESNDSKAPLTPIYAIPALSPTQQVASAQKEVVKSKDGLDFKSLMGGGPAQQAQMAMAPVMMYPNGMYPPGYGPTGYPQVGMQGYGRPPMPTWAMVPPDQQMVNTPNGPMTQAMAMQLNLPWQPLNQQPNQQFNNNGGYGFSPNPTWAGR